jgi:uncharacterized protein (TIGR03435 family)
VIAVLALVAATFDVASIKPSRIERKGGENSRREHVAVSPTGVTMLNVSLSYCIQWAYSVKFYQVEGPDWVKQQRYEIVAKTEQPVSTADLRIMLQALLTDRFKLKLRRESKSKPIYAVVARKKLLPARTSGTATFAVVDGSFVFDHTTMAEFAERLSDLSAIDRPVIDKTGLEGSYDITLKSAARAMLAEPSSIFTAIVDAGLKLEPRHGAVETFVVEQAEAPSPN